MITGGEKVSTIEVERVLMEMKGVRAAEVYGTLHEKWREKVTARIEIQDGTVLTEKEMLDFCKERLAHFKCPKKVEFKPIPWTATGKMQKYLLRRNALLRG